MKAEAPPNESNDPHPKHCAIAAAANSGGDTDDIACSHPGCRGYHQRLEGGYRASSLGPLPYHPDGLGKEPELDKAGAQGKVEPRRNQQHNQDIGIQPIIHNGNQLTQPGSSPFSREYFVKTQL